MDIAAARQAIAALINGIPTASLAIRATADIKAGRQGDGWVVVRNVRPGERFGPGVLATIEAVIIAGHDALNADEFVTAHATAVLRAVNGDPDLAARDVTVEPQQLLVGDTAAPQYVLTITATVEVE